MLSLLWPLGIRSTTWVCSDIHVGGDQHQGPEWAGGHVSHPHIVQNWCMAGEIWVVLHRHFERVQPGAEPGCCKQKLWNSFWVYHRPSYLFQVMWPCVFCQAKLNMHLGLSWLDWDRFIFSFHQPTHPQANLSRILAKLKGSLVRWMRNIDGRQLLWDTTFSGGHPLLEDFGGKRSSMVGGLC